MKVWYFGCANDEKGHYMQRPDGTRDWEWLDTNPWRYHIDAGLCTKGTETEGLATRHFKDGYTALAFWDRSVDRRGKSNSAFIAEGEHTADRMWELAQQHFPKIVTRFKFRIVVS